MGTTVRDLLADLPADEAAFVARHRRPAVMSDPLDGAGPAVHVDTPSRPLEGGVGNSTEVLGPLQAAKQLTRSAEQVDQRARVAFLEKSERNPFVGLVTVGRARNNDIVIDRATVSKLHAIFTTTDEERWFVEDDSSSNGTFLNGVQLKAKEKTAISDGDSLRLGPDIQLRFFEPDSLWNYLQTLTGLA